MNADFERPHQEDGVAVGSEGPLYSDGHDTPKPDIGAFLDRFWGLRELEHEHKHGSTIDLTTAHEPLAPIERAPEVVAEYEPPADEHTPNHPYSFLDAKNAQRRWEEYSVLLLPVYERYLASIASGEQWRGPLADKEFLEQGYGNLTGANRDMVSQYWQYLNIPKTEPIDVISEIDL